MQSESRMVDHKTQLKYSQCSSQLKYSNWWILAAPKTVQGKWFVQTVQIYPCELQQTCRRIYLPEREMQSETDDGTLLQGTKSL